MAHLWPISTKQLNMFQDWYLYVNKGSCAWPAPRLPIPTAPAGKLACTAWSLKATHAGLGHQGWGAVPSRELCMRLTDQHPLFPFEIHPATPETQRQHRSPYL